MIEFPMNKQMIFLRVPTEILRHIDEIYRTRLKREDP